MFRFPKKKIEKIAKNYQIADIYIFGSQVLKLQHPGSDFDIAVRFKKGLPNPEKRGKIYGNLFSDISLIFKKEKIDLIFLDEAPLHFQFKVINNGKLIYSESFNNSCNFVEKIANLYRDYKYFIDEYFQGILESAK